MLKLVMFYKLKKLFVIVMGTIQIYNFHRMNCGSLYLILSLVVLSTKHVSESPHEYKLQRWLVRNMKEGLLKSMLKMTL